MYYIFKSIDEYGSQKRIVYSRLKMRSITPFVLKNSPRFSGMPTLSDEFQYVKEIHSMKVKYLTICVQNGGDVQYVGDTI